MPRFDPLENTPSAEGTGPRAEEIFYAVLQAQDPAARTAALRAACGDDEALRREVNELLAAHQAAESFFADGSAALNPRGDDGSDDLAALPDALVGEWVGPYRLVQCLGEGGGGVVYLAEQEEPVRRRVALKIIKLGMDTRSVIARFQAERQALAMMDHPNIARVLDAGATETGRPYFVMEYVPGVRITDYCVENRLDLPARLGLFRQVCHAIQHSHQKGIIHRDIKPSNILITLHDEAPVPKVIDFGIAKATGGRLPGQTTATRAGQLIGTPAYMSPEQVDRGALDVDTRSDIYSLGVVLYELLTGRTPFDSRQLLQAGVDEMERKLREDEPPRPSAMVRTAAAADPAPAPVAGSSLRGDLDWIVMKALEKDRDRRYQTARGLAMDVERYLEEEPVLARPPSRFYRLHKLVRRNKAAFTALAVAALALVAGTVVSTALLLKAREAERHEAELRRRAEVREKITHGAILLSQGRMEDANALLGTTALPVFGTSLEATSVFRTLGEWSAVQGRWPEAAARMVALVQVNQIDPSDQTDAATRDLLMAAPALLEARDLAGFARLRQLAISRFAHTANPVAAEHILKISALQPIDQETLRSLEPLRQAAGRSLENWNPQTGNGIEAWRCAVLGLLDYRRGGDASALRWCELALANPDGNLSRRAMIYLTRAMCAHRLGRAAEAAADLARAHGLIDQSFQKGLSLERGKDGGWFDWVGARILEREAAKLIAAPPETGGQPVGGAVPLP